MRTNTCLFFSYLRAQKMYGPRAGNIDAQFCFSSLGLSNPLLAVTELQRIGLPVEITAGGNIRLSDGGGHERIG